MTKTKKILVVAAMLIALLACGAWTVVDGAVETRYADPTLLSTYADERIDFTSRDVVGPVTTPGKCPYYYHFSDMPNSCGAVAGAEIVAYYDKYFPNLIPDWDSYFPSTGKYRSQNSTYVEPMMRDLYTRMRTNVDDVGVSQTDCLNGLTSYVNSKGYQVSYQSVMSGSTLNFEQCKTAIANNKVIILFAAPTSVYDLSVGNDHDTLIPINISGAHIMVLYGYCETIYYNNGVQFRHDKYFYVAMGMAGYTSKLYKVNDTATQAAYVVNIT